GSTTSINLFLALVVVGPAWIVLPAASVGARSNAPGGVVSEPAPRTVHATATEHAPSPTTGERALQRRSWRDGLRSPRTPVDASAPVRTGRPQVPASRAMSTRAKGASGGSVG